MQQRCPKGETVEVIWNISLLILTFRMHVKGRQRERKKGRVIIFSAQSHTYVKNSAAPRQRSSQQKPRSSAAQRKAMMAGNAFGQ